MTELTVYQINLDRDDNNVAFLPLNLLDTYQETSDIDPKIYEKVFTGQMDVKNLEDIYRKLNIDKPEDFSGRSLSVSDLVEITESDFIEKGTYYCDTVGFQKVDFDPSKIPDPESLKIKVVLLEPGKMARTAEIGSDLTSLQKTVGGLIEAYYPFEEEVCIVCNDEGKINGLPINRGVFDKEGDLLDVIAGTCFICDCSGENFSSLSKEQIGRYLEEFKYPEKLCMKDGKYYMIPYEPKTEKNMEDRT